MNSVNIAAAAAVVEVEVFTIMPFCSSEVDGGREGESHRTEQNPSVGMGRTFQRGENDSTTEHHARNYLS